MKVILISDIHNCHRDWYGVRNGDRMEKLVKDLNEYRIENPYEAVFMLGDYSLDFWEKVPPGGSFNNQGVSYTANFIRNYVSRLDCKEYYMIPGNHEQYGHAKWKEITGFERQFCVEKGGYLFIMLDNFAGDLDPYLDSHGTITPTDTEFIKLCLAEHPGIPVILCAHFFDPGHITEEFKALLKNEDRILCLFSGHNHVDDVHDLGEACGNKKIYYDGHFSYTGLKREYPLTPWGWMTLDLQPKGLSFFYHMPASTLNVRGIGYSYDAADRKSVFIHNPLNGCAYQ